MSRSLVHILLSLLLLITQQMALDHGVMHRGQAASVVLATQESMQDAGQAPAHGGNPVKPVLHHLCSHCAAGAHLAFMLPVLAFAFVPRLLSFDTAASHQADGIWRLATRAFDPRGPPSGK